jgi:hypothetical protein
VAGGPGTQFTCFTGTIVHILTLLLPEGFFRKERVCTSEGWLAGGTEKERAGWGGRGGGKEEAGWGGRRRSGRRK